MYSASTPEELYFQTVGFTRPPLPYEAIDLRVTNETEYRAWRVKLNGIKRRNQGDSAGYFGVINLLGPRSPRQPGGPDTQWNPEFTFVQLRYSFVGRNSGNPIVIDRTYLTFYDFDTGVPRFDGSEAQVEVMQMWPQASSLSLAPNTELQTYASWFSYLSTSAYSSFMATSPQGWSTPVTVGTQYGIGNDNLCRRMS
jgi:hypothetical protein